MFQIATILFIIRNYIKYKFINFDYHSIYRSLFCLLISISSCFIIFFNWDQFIEDPFTSIISSTIINTFMLIYMLYDLIWMFYKQIFRKDLIIHHIVCLIIYYLYYTKLILTFYAINECMSAFNWITIIYPSPISIRIVKILRLCTIIFIRLWVWINGFILLSGTEQYSLALVSTIIFMSLDVYWLYVIFINFNKKILIKTKKIIKKGIEKSKDIKFNTKKNLFKSFIKK